MFIGKGKKGWLLYSVTLLIVIGLVAAGCSGNSGNNVQPSPASTPSESLGQGSDPSQEVIELTWMVNDVVLPNSLGQKFVEDRFNVKLNIITVPRADYVQRQQIMMTTGEVPDVMIVMDPNEMKKYVDQGLLAEVPVELIEQYAPGIKSELDNNATEGWFYTEHNEKNYGVPTLFGGKNTTTSAWRVDLLEKAGIAKKPETIDEMTAAFEALKKINVYGTSSNGNSDYLTFQKIFGAFGIMPIQWTERNGQVMNGAVMPEAKEALTLLADWYSKGYIDPEFVTGKDLSPKFLDGVFAYNDNVSINATDESNPNSAISALKKINPDGKIELGLLPKGPRGESGGWSWGTAANGISFGVHMENQPEKLQRALEIIDTVINDEEVYVQLSYGTQGKHWNFKNGTDLTEGIEYMPPYDDVIKLREEGIKGGETFFGGRPNFELFYKYSGERLKEIYETYGKNPIADIFGKPDILPSAGLYWGDLKKLKIEAYAAIIRGDQPIDYFDSFVKQWNDMGGEQLRQEAQALYDSLQ
jgi:putative aldouronate transport system substrate-binding protein